MEKSDAELQKLDGRKRRFQSTQYAPPPKTLCSRQHIINTPSKKVRVWWPPTTDPGRTYYGGMYWPGVVIGRNENTGELHVRYDNDSSEWVNMDFVQPREVPLKHGEEADGFKVGEFVEVHNSSKTDPAEWVGIVARVLDRVTYLIEYPFCDSRPERKSSKLLRRARVYDFFQSRWLLVKPNQRFSTDEVTSPMELETVPEVILDASDAEEGEETEGAGQQQGARRRGAGAAAEKGPGSGADGLSKLLLLTEVAAAVRSPSSARKKKPSKKPAGDRGAGQGGGVPDANPYVYFEGRLLRGATRGRGGSRADRERSTGAPLKRPAPKEEEEEVVVVSDEEEGRDEGGAKSKSKQPPAYRWTEAPTFYTAPLVVGEEGTICLPAASYFGRP